MSQSSIGTSGPSTGGADSFRIEAAAASHLPSNWDIRVGLNPGVPARVEVHHVLDGHTTRVQLQNINKTAPSVYGTEVFVRSENNHAARTQPWWSSGGTRRVGKVSGRRCVQPPGRQAGLSSMTARLVPTAKTPA